MSNELNTVALQENLKETEIPANRQLHVPPIFVVGVWRSGTTLLYALLNQHPDIRLMYESDLPVLWPVFRVPWIRKAWPEKWECWNAGLSRHDMNSAALSDPVTSLADAMEQVGRKYAAAKGKKLWGCKSPSYYDRLVSLSREFPQARFIIIWRDPEEICDSVIRAASSGMWFARPGTPRKALLASKILKRQTEKLIARGAFVHQIHYRDLVEDTTATMRGICQFLQVPFTAAVTILEKADRSAVFTGAHHKLARGNQIVSRKARNEAVPPALAAKIERYKALWKSESGDGWLLSQRFPEDGLKPGIWERATDRLLLTILRTRDVAPRILFSILPMSVWQTYRRFKYKDVELMRRQLTNKPTSMHGN
jgi:hypothetical protein